MNSLPTAVRGTVAVLTGRGTGTVLAVALVTLDGAYYGVFCGLLLAAAGILALVRTWNWRRFGGAVVAGVVLGVVLIGAMLPDILYERGQTAAMPRHSCGSTGNRRSTRSNWCR